MSGIIAQNSGRHTGLVKASSGGGGVWNLIKTYTASGDADLSFVEGTDDIDFTAYDEFVFKFIDIHPETDAKDFSFNFSTDTGSNYNVTKTTTTFFTFNTEADDETNLFYYTATDIAQGTGFQATGAGMLGSDTDECIVGNLYLFNPSSTVFVKHFTSTFNYVEYRDRSISGFIAGYGNTTSAIDAVQFKMTSGNIDAGQISLYGIS